jgi:hypothetical protein
MADFGLEPLLWETLDNRGMAEKAKAVYEKIKDGLEAEHMGKVVAIDVESGDYFLGETGLEAARQAKARYPSRIPYIMRIGRPAYISFRRLERKE